jgi:hypothetical protein
MIEPPPAHVRVTIVAGPRGPTVRQRIAALLPRVSARMITCLAALAVVVAAVGGLTLRGSATGCVSVGIAFHDPRFGRASFDRRFPCLRGFDAHSQGGGRVLGRPPVLAIRRHT